MEPRHYGGVFALQKNSARKPGGETETLCSFSVLKGVFYETYLKTVLWTQSSLIKMFSQNKIQSNRWQPPVRSVAAAETTCSLLFLHGQ